MKKSILLSLALIFAGQSISPSEFTSNIPWKWLVGAASCAMLYKIYCGTAPQQVDSLQAQVDAWNCQRVVVSNPVAQQECEAQRDTLIQQHAHETLKKSNEVTSGIALESCFAPREARRVRFAEGDTAGSYFVNNNLYQASVLKQDSGRIDPLGGQYEGTNCAYHALKNAITGLHYCAGLSTSQDVVNFEAYRDFMKPLMVEIYRLRGNRSYTMLSGHEIDYLISKCFVNRRSSMTVIDSFEVFENPSKMSDDSLRVLEAVSQKNACVHAFIINTDALKPASTERGFHWATYLLVKKDKEVKVICMDSALDINLDIARKVQSLAVLHKDEIQSRAQAMHEEQVVAHAAELQEAAALTDLYSLQGYAVADCSLGLVDFESLPFGHLLSNSTHEEVALMKQAFEQAFPDRIVQERKGKMVLIDGVVDQAMTEIHQADIVTRYPVKKYIFTVWKSQQGQWHIEYDTGVDEARFIQQRQQQVGRKLPNDRNLRFDDVKEE